MRNIISEICELFTCRYDMLAITGNPSLKDTYLYLQDTSASRPQGRLLPSTAGLRTLCHLGCFLFLVPSSTSIQWFLETLGKTFLCSLYSCSLLGKYCKCIIQPLGMLPSSHCTFPSSPHRPLTWLPAITQVQVWSLVQVDHTKMFPLGKVAVISRRNCQSRSIIILQGASSSTSRMDPSLSLVFCNKTLCQINWESSKISASFRNILWCHRQYQLSASLLPRMCCRMGSGV